jgi:hypothetical protein
MAYSTNPNLAKARAFALKLLILQRTPLQVVANCCGVHRSTVWRWKRAWLRLNANQQLENNNRPQRAPGRQFRLLSCRWLIPTRSSRPHTSPRAISAAIVARILELRRSLRRCAEVIWHYAITTEQLSVSLGSVRRILRRHHCFDGARKPRVRYDNPRRPHVTRPGELVQTDTIHHVDPKTGRRLYYYTVIDLFTRMTHVILVAKLSPLPWCKVTMGPSMAGTLNRSCNGTAHKQDTAGYTAPMTMPTSNGSTVLSKKNALGTPGTGAFRSRPSKLG